MKWIHSMNQVLLYECIELFYFRLNQLGAVGDCFFQSRQILTR